METKTYTPKTEAAWLQWATNEARLDEQGRANAYAAFQAGAAFGGVVNADLLAMVERFVAAYESSQSWPTQTAIDDARALLARVRGEAGPNG